MPRMNTTSGGIPKSNGGNTSGNIGWKEVHQRIRDLRRTFVHLFVKTPTDITFRQLGQNLIRCYFLLSPGQGRESTLYYADVNTEPNLTNRLSYHEVLDTTNSFLWRRISKEEQLQSERRRITTWGITNYELHEESGTLVFPAASTIFQCVHPQRPTWPVSVKELLSTRVRLNPRLNPQICPSNPQLIAFSAIYDIYMYNIKTGEEKRVTHTYGGNGKLEYNPKSAGVPSYVMQEEFSRYQGYWWQPVSPDGVYRLIYEEVDETKVPIVQFLSPDENSVDEFRFPRAGMANAESTLKLLEVELGPNGEIRTTTRNLKQELKELLPKHEYLVRVGWTPDGAHIWCQALDRRQQHLQMVLLSLSSFSGAFYKNQLSNPLFSTLQTLPPQCIVSQQSSTWIDVHNMLYWFKTQPDPMQRMFIFASEQSGFRHLYLRVVQLVHSAGSNNYEVPSQEESGVVSAKVLNEIALTGGEWSVLTNGLWVDEKLGLVYFMGLKDTPLEQHLYVTSLSRPGVTQRITYPNFSHQVFMNDDCSIFVTVFSNLQSPNQTQIYRLVPGAPNETDCFVWASCLGDLVGEQHSESLLEIKPLVVPEVFTTAIKSGDNIYSMVFKPHNYVPGRKYPTVLYIYGGPQVQLVSNTFKGFRHMRTHMLAAHGFCVVSIDSRGSDNRGVKFQAHILNRMGTVEIEDQLEVLQTLSGKYKFIDLSRLAVFGWSYGGYLSLMALAQRPDCFKLAIAGAPVVSWNLYDTGYTERYMDLPSVNNTGYRTGAVLSYIHSFPDQENRLLIVQGMIDENVHFTHTNKLIQALIKAGKPYQLQIYPRERHCLRQLDSNEHYETKLLSFLIQNL